MMLNFCTCRARPSSWQYKYATSGSTNKDKHFKWNTHSLVRLGHKNKSIIHLNIYNYVNPHTGFKPTATTGSCVWPIPTPGPPSDLNFPHYLCSCTKQKRCQRGNYSVILVAKGQLKGHLPIQVKGNKCIFLGWTVSLCKLIELVFTVVDYKTQAEFRSLFINFRMMLDWIENNGTTDMESIDIV